MRLLEGASMRYLADDGVVVVVVQATRRLQRRVAILQAPIYTKNFNDGELPELNFKLRGSSYFM